MTHNSSPQEIFRRCRTAVPSLRAEPVSERKQRLTALRRWIHSNRSRIHAAVYKDFRKPSIEVDATEIFHVLNEITGALRSVDRWAAPFRTSTPFYLAGTRSWIQYEPRGVCLIISPWNYPFGLAAGPLVSALAAGNSVIIKPSEHAPAVSSLLREMCDEVFEPQVVSVCEGGVSTAQELLSLPFDHIFFTGSPQVGKIVMKAAAEHLTSITLELGGKSPAIVTDSANLDDAAERIALGKFMNNGQTCIAPDYILADEKIVARLIPLLIEKTKKLFAPDGKFEESPDYARIVNETNFMRIKTLLDDAIEKGAKPVWQGPSETSSRFFHPVILTDVSPDSRIMTEEIFGPVLPVLTINTLDEALEIIHARPKPLALYIFTSSKTHYNSILKATSSGTACINDCGVQFLHSDLPFGGVNHSGIGVSHGQFGFRAFSNEKAVLKQRSGITAVKLFYPPYTNRTKRLMDWFLRLF